MLLYGWKLLIIIDLPTSKNTNGCSYEKRCSKTGRKGDKRRRFFKKLHALIFTRENSSHSSQVFLNENTQKLCLNLLWWNFTVIVARCYRNVVVYFFLNCLFLISKQNECIETNIESNEFHDMRGNKIYLLPFCLVVFEKSDYISSCDICQINKQSLKSNPKTQTE